MKGILKSLGGLALVLAWWTLKGPPDDPNHESSQGIPTTVWEGGGASFEIEADTTSAAQMRVSFSQEIGDGDEKQLETWEDVPAGHHRWTIDVPSGVGGYVELGAVDPKPGDELRWTLRVDGETIDEQTETLERPLEENYAFFLQSYFDDYASGNFEED